MVPSIEEPKEPVKPSVEEEVQAAVSRILEKTEKPVELPETEEVSQEREAVEIPEKLEVPVEEETTEPVKISEPVEVAEAPQVEEVPGVEEKAQPVEVSETEMVSVTEKVAEPVEISEPVETMVSEDVSETAEISEPVAAPEAEEVVEARKAPEAVEVPAVAPEVQEIEEAVPEVAEEIIPEVKEKPATSYSDGLAKTRGGFISKLKNLFKSSAVDDDLIEEMEEILYTADIGVNTVTHFLTEIEKNRKNFSSGEDVRDFLKKMIYDIVKPVEKKLDPGMKEPSVLLMVGVNGAGKTTTIGKLTKKFKDGGRDVILAAGDTFRAAAVEQLMVWGQRTDTEVIRDKEGADPASVAFNAVNSAVSRGKDTVIIDTAGRLQNRVNLMEELKKVGRVIGKAKEGAPHEVILVVDANNGQNALSQARQFNEAVGLTGIVITKLDGTAKGGVVIGIARELGLPIYYVGIGEAVGDLREFNADQFVEALFESNEN